MTALCSLSLIWNILKGLLVLPAKEDQPHWSPASRRVYVVSNVCVQFPRRVLCGVFVALPLEPSSYRTL